MTISTSVWSAQHPNAGRNIQQRIDSNYHFFLTKGLVTVCEERSKINQSQCVAIELDFNDFQWPSKKEMAHRYVINYTGSTHWGVKTSLKHGEYMVTMNGVMVRKTFATHYRVQII